MSSVVVTAEYEPLEDIKCSAEDREAFRIKFPKTLFTTRKGTFFSHAGLYQIGRDQVFLVLPWFLDRELLSTGTPFESSQNGTTGLLDLIRGIRACSVEEIGLMANDQTKLASEFLFFSFLSRLHQVVEEARRQNQFTERQEELPTIRGKWLSDVDLRLELKPIRFNCRFDDSNIETPILVFAKAMADFLSSRVLSNRNRAIISEIMCLLETIETNRLSVDLFDLLSTKLRREKNGVRWIPLVEFGQSIFTHESSWTAGAGFAFRLPMPRVFETLIEDSLRNTKLSISTQTRAQVLGGALWIHTKENALNEDIDDDSEQDNVSVAAQYSIPDIVASDPDGNTFIIDCKYKRLNIPGIGPNGESGKPFSREDRNQMLSFILSAHEYEARSTFSDLGFAIVFPHNGVQIAESAFLEFPKAQLTANVDAITLIRTPRPSATGQSIKICFIAVNPSKAIADLHSHSLETAERIISLLQGRFALNRAA